MISRKTTSIRPEKCVLSLVFFICNFVGFSQSYQASIGSCLVPEYKEMDLGEVKKISKTHFSVENRCDSAVLIKEVVVQCGCTAPTYSKNWIEPGENAEIEVLFDPKGKEGFERKTIHLIWNNGEKTKLVLIANVLR